MTDIVEMLKAGIQGGAATPEIFKTITEAILETVIQMWLAIGFGILLNDGSVLTHLVRADNIWLFATNIQDMEIMTQQLTDAVIQAGFRWKPASLEYLHIGTPALAEPELSIFQREQRYEYKHTTDMWVLGTLLNQKGDTPKFSKCPYGSSTKTILQAQQRLEF